MTYFLQKLAMGVATLLVLATVCFFLTKLAGEEAAFGEKNPPEEVRRAIAKRWGLDLPLHQQYVLHMSKLLTLDSMDSRKHAGQSMRDVLGDYLPSSIRLGVRALILAIMLGVPIGVLCAVYHNRWIDNGGMLLALVGVSLPSFILASLAIFLLSRQLNWLPAIGWDQPSYPFEVSRDMNPALRGVLDEVFRVRLWVPAACLAAFPFAAILRLTRSSMLDALDQDYVRTARAKGLDPRVVILKHALRNALTPVVTYLGPVTAGVLTGSLVVEKIFAIPGIGSFFVTSVNDRDMPIIMGLTVFYSALLLTMNLLVDALYPVLNPRLRKD